MIPEKLKTRLPKHRSMKTVAVRMPEDIVASLKATAPLKGMSGYQPLLKTYVSEGLRRDEAIYVFGSDARLVKALKKRGVPAKLIADAKREAAG